MTASPALSMALGQLITSEVLEQNILDAMVSVPREKYVPAALAGAAHVDDDLPIGNGRFLLAPLTFAHLIQLAEITRKSKVLDVGCTLGYSTAVIARLAKEAIGSECDREMAEAARRNLDAAGAKNARVVHVVSLPEGYSSDQPYDAIIVNGAMSGRPASLLKMLKDGGRLVGVEKIGPDRPGLTGGLGRIVLYVNRDGDIQKRDLWEASAPLLPGFAQASAFEF